MPKADHGGKRAGAGRKPIDPKSQSVTIALSLPESLLERLDAVAAKHNWNRAEAVREAIRGLVAKK
jgi:Ribbon-helix-helix protein, copG family